MICDPLEFVRTHVRPKSLCSEVVVEWLAAHGVDVGLSRRDQMRLWARAGAIAGADEISRRLGARAAGPEEAQDGDIALACTSAGPTLGLVRAGRFLAAASGSVMIQSGPLIKAWRLPCRW